MNQVFKVIWNSHIKEFVVVSELAKGYCRVSVTNNCLKIIVASILLFSPTAFSKDYAVPDYTPQNNSKTIGQIIISNGDIANLTTGLLGFGNIASGLSGYKTMTLQDALNQGYITSGQDNVNLIQTDFGGKTKYVQYVDPVTGSTRTTVVYDNNNFNEIDVSGLNTTISLPTGNNQYVDMKLATVTSGGVLNVNVGSTGADWVTNPQNMLKAYTKESNIFNIETTATDINDAVLNYNSKTIISTGNISNVANPGGNDYNFSQTSYNGNITSVIGSFQVNNLAEFKTYNNALISALQNGKITPDQYDDELSKAYTSSNKNIHIGTTISPDDPVFLPANRDVNSYIKASGAHSIININNDAIIQAVSSDTSVIRLTEGATLNNNGTLGVATGAAGGDYVVYATDSVVNNLGVIDAGTSKDIQNAWRGAHTGIFANGNSQIKNDGIINIAAHQYNWSSYAVMLNGSSSFNNNTSGIINVATGGEPDNSLNGLFTYGLMLQDNSTANNSGNIYIGRTAQSSQTDTTNNVDIKLPAIGVYNAGGSFVNNGTITIEDQVSNAIAVQADGKASTTTLTIQQNGVINVNGKTDGTNVAVDGINKASKITNSGEINLTGYNGIAIRLSGGSKATSSGKINITGSNSANASQKNFGAWVEGAGSELTLTGGINLDADNAIGLHARDGALIDISDTGKVTFGNGKNQIGYFIYGTDSVIKNASTVAQNVSTDGSTLYRLEAGATFNGANQNHSMLSASGDSSTIAQVIGHGSTFSSGNLAFDITGNGASGIKVEGGANALLTKDVIVTKVSGNDTTMGIVDGNYYDPQGNIDPARKGESVLTSYATLNSSNTTSGAFGYITRNGGTLNHLGTIHFDQPGSTGILVSGGTLNNDGDIDVNGIAINIQGANSIVNNTTTVNASEGTAAYFVGNDATLHLTGLGTTRAAGSAHAILLDTGAKGLTIDGATIDMDTSGMGNAIENKAGISGIQLNNTIINVGNGIGIHTGASLAQANSGTINANGAGAGLLFENVIDGSVTDQSLDISGSNGLTIRVNSADGHGILTRSSADLKTAATVNVLNKNGNAALTIQGTSKNVEQSGRLTSQSTTSAVVDADNGALESFTNKGEILALNAAQTALEMTKGNGISFTNASGAKIHGQVNLLSGNNTVTLATGSTATAINTGAGADTFILNNTTANESTSLFTSISGGQGNDTLRLEDAAFTLESHDAIQGIENIDLTGNSIFTLQDVSLALGDNQLDTNATGYAIGHSSELHLNASSDMTFLSHLSGTGSVSVNTAGHEFSFDGNNSADGFAGTVLLSNSKFMLDGNNTQALSHGTLKAGHGSITTVGAGGQDINGLVFAGGTVIFSGATPGASSATGTINAKEMDVLGKGTVQVDTGTISNDRPLAPTSTPLLSQDDTQSLIKLATSDTLVKGDAGNLILEDSNGNLITEAMTAAISQAGNVVAQGTWDYRLTSGEKNDGLYINYGLTQIELLGKGSDSLILDATGKTANAADLSAKITGNGDLAFSSQPGQTVTLSNMDNDYRGVTDVRSGTLTMLNDNVLGNTSELRLATDTGFDMQGHSQKVGKLTTEANTLIHLNNGDLTLAEGGTASGELAGNGKLTIADGTLNVYGENRALGATITIDQGASVNLDHSLGLGSGDIVATGSLSLNRTTGTLYNNLSDIGNVALVASNIVMAGNNSQFSGSLDIDASSSLAASGAEQLGSADIQNNGTLQLNSANHWILDNTVSGSGNVIKEGEGSVTLANNTEWTGITDIIGGGLILGNGDESVNLASSHVNIHQNGWLSGFGRVAGNMDIQGKLLIGNHAPGNFATREVTTPTVFTVEGNLLNRGHISTGSEGGITGNQLIINGDYAAENGYLHLNTVLAEDDAKTDKLVIKGNTSGTTLVSVTNAGGSGAKTLNGIEVISIAGRSEGEFQQAGRIVAGAYDYTLARGQGNHNSNWYLTSQKTVAESTPDTAPSQPSAPDVRPEVGSYTANMAAANTLFITRLHDRSGAMQYVDALSGEYKATSMWMRQVGGHNAWRDNSSQLKTQSNRYVMQIGGDIARFNEEGNDRWHLGVMAGYGHNSSRTRSSVTGYSSDGSVNGYSAGLYATWYANDETHQGAYLDSWLQYNWFNNNVKGEDIQGESYKSKGITASLETGYTHKIGDYYSSKGSLSEWFIQPQAQVIWMGVEADDYKESNGTHIQNQGNGNIQTRLGMRSFLKSRNAIDAGKDREFQPFVEVNWIHNTRKFGTRMDGVSILQTGASNLGDIKIGVEGHINQKLNIWGNVGVQVGEQGYNDANAMIGLKYTFK